MQKDRDGSILTHKELDEQRELNRQWSELLDETLVNPAAQESRDAQASRNAHHKAWQKKFAESKGAA